MAVTFDDTVRRVLDGKNFATVATLLPDGSPQTSVVWYRREGDQVVFSTTSRRRKARNLERDPRVSLTVFDLENPYLSVEVRGTAELVPDPDKALPKELAQRYLGSEPPAEEEGEVRLLVRITPERVITFSP